MTDKTPEQTILEWLETQGQDVREYISDMAELAKMYSATEYGKFRYRDFISAIQALPPVNTTDEWIEPDIRHDCNKLCEVLHNGRWQRAVLLGKSDVWMAVILGAPKSGVFKQARIRNPNYKPCECSEAEEEQPESSHERLDMRCAKCNSEITKGRPTHTEADGWLCPHCYLAKVQSEVDSLDAEEPTEAEILADMKVNEKPFCKLPKSHQEFVTEWRRDPKRYERMVVKACTAENIVRCNEPVQRLDGEWLCPIPNAIYRIDHEPPKQEEPANPHNQPAIGETVTLPDGQRVIVRDGKGCSRCTLYGCDCVSARGGIGGIRFRCNKHWRYDGTAIHFAPVETDSKQEATEAEIVRCPQCGHDKTNHRSDDVRDEKRNVRL